MAKYSIPYFILDKDDNVVFESSVDVSFTKADIKELENFVCEHDYSPEFVDMPAHMYDKCTQKAFDLALREYEPFADPENELCLAFEPYIPESLWNELPDDVQEKMNNSIPDDEVAGEEEPELVPTKENTLYLTIKQTYFDQIIAGTKKEEYREIKETTYKRYLEVDENGYPLLNADLFPKDFDTEELAPDDDLFSLLSAWNDGNCFLLPKRSICFLNLAVGYNKERDTAIVEVEDISFTPAMFVGSKPYRFWVNPAEGGIIPAADGNMVLWNATFHLGRIVECHRKQ